MIVMRQIVSTAQPNHDATSDACLFVYAFPQLDLIVRDITSVKGMLKDDLGY